MIVMSENQKLVNQIFDFFMMLPTDMPVTQVQVIANRKTAEVVGKLPNGQSIFEHMQNLVKNPEELLAAAKAAGEESLANGINDFMGVFQRVKMIEEQRVN